MVIKKMDIKEIARKIEKSGGRIYLVGGALRDEKMGKQVIDEDYCVVGISQNEFEHLFPNAIIRGKDFAVYDINGREFALARTERKNGKGHKNFEIKTDKNITIEQDLARRDITINSIAKDVLTGEIIDPYNGMKDIENKVIKMTSKSFKEDPLRVYRIARFASTLGFEVEKETIEQMKLLREELKSLSVERVFSEFKKALTSDKPSIFFNVLREANVLDIHFREIYDLIGKTQPENYHPEGDSYNHTMMVLDYSARLTNKLEIRYSCLVHDLGKGTTPMEILPHHYGHEERGEELVRKMGHRLKVPNLWTKCGQTAAKEHMKGGKFTEMTPKKQIDFIEKVSKSRLGLEGMRIVVMCDKNRDGKYPENVKFDKIGYECIQRINGDYIKKKYNIDEGIELNKKLHEERINWIKKYYQLIDNK